MFSCSLYLSLSFWGSSCCALAQLILTVMSTRCSLMLLWSVVIISCCLSDSFRPCFSLFLVDLAHYQVPSQSHDTFLVPEQDSPYESLDESSGDSSEMNSEETQSGRSSPLSPDLEEQGSSFAWTMFGPSEFALPVYGPQRPLR